MQGRIFSLIMTLAMGAGPIGLIIAGPIAEMYDARTMFLISGSICVILGLGAFFVPSLRGIESGSGSGSGSN
jgi:DHA3 family macrolide efflux protein-like MFS transporter